MFYECKNFKNAGEQAIRLIKNLDRSTFAADAIMTNLSKYPQTREKLTIQFRVSCQEVQKNLVHTFFTSFIYVNSANFWMTKIYICWLVLGSKIG